MNRPHKEKEPYDGRGNTGKISIIFEIRKDQSTARQDSGRGTTAKKKKKKRHAMLPAGGGRNEL